MITRADVVNRARTGWPMGGVPYSQVAHHSPDGYRQDCSGFASMAWKLPASFNTATLVTEGVMTEIPFADLRPGDALGRCGPGTEGDAGHIQIVTEPLAGMSNRIIEQRGGPPGPVEQIEIRSGRYRAYRYVRIADSLPTIARGATGPAVRMAQQRLNAHGATLAVDGIFGPLTDAATRAFQTAVHIEVDGIIGPITWSHL